MAAADDPRLKSGWQLNKPSRGRAEHRRYNRPHPFQHSSRMADLIPSPTSHSYFSQRMRLHYLDWGNATAPNMLLVHGMRDHGHNWDWLARSLCGDHHIVAPDLRGHGDSEWPQGGSYSNVDYVYDLAQLVHQIRFTRCTMIAHSMGGTLACIYAGLYPEHVERLIVIEAVGLFRYWGRFRAEQRDTSAGASEVLPEVLKMREWVDSSRQLAGRLPKRYATLEEAYQRMQLTNPHLSPDRARHLTVHGSNQNEDGTYTWKFDNYTHAMSPYDMPYKDTMALWKNIRCPVLLVSGSESWARHAIDRGDITKQFQNARHQVIDDAGHWVHHDQLAIFLNMSREFLSA